jgi:hypothetical protein
MRNEVLCAARLFVPLAAAVAAGACYSYTAVRPDALEPGEEIRARVTAEQAERLEELLQRRPRVLEGRFVEQDGRGLLLDVPTTSRTGRGGMEVLHQRIILVPDAVVELERKQLDRLRTGGVLLGAAAVAGYALFAKLSGEPGSERPPDPGTPELRVPVGWRLPMP